MKSIYHMSNTMSYLYVCIPPQPKLQPGAPERRQGLRQRAQITYMDVKVGVMKHRDDQVAVLDNKYGRGTTVLWISEEYDFPVEALSIAIEKPVINKLKEKRNGYLCEQIGQNYRGEHLWVDQTKLDEFVTTVKRLTKTAQKQQQSR